MTPTANPPNAGDDAAWPPGTIYLEDLLRTQGEDIILQPRPSTDPNDPLNWPRWRKYLNFGLAAFYVVMVFTLIDVATPTWGPMNTELGFSYDILNDSYAVGAASLTLGAFFLIPFALKYGRRPIYIISTALQFGVAIWSAKIQTVADLMLVNVFGCGLGALADVICQMTIADVFFVHERGLMTSISVWTSNVGGQLAPVAAGYITTNEGWRWVWWWTTIFFGVTFLAFVFLYEETKFTQPTIEAIESYDPQSRQLATLEASSNDDTKTSKIDEMPAGADLEKSTLPPSDGPSIDHSIPQKTYLQRLNLLTTSPGSWEMFARHAWQPVVILVTNPTVFYVSLVYGGCIATNTVLITTLSSWMTLPPYNFDSAQIGLMSLPAWIGTSLGTLVCGPVSDWLILKLARRNNGIYEPEMRLWAMVPFMVFVPAGTFMFGIGLNNGASWPVLAVGYAMYNFGSAPATLVAVTYLMDSYTEILADALVGISCTRNLLSCIFVFAITPWIDNVGMQNVYVTVGVLLSAILLLVFIFIYYGKRLRVRTVKQYRYWAARQFDPRPI